jgi:uncharacterized protein DUF6004
VKRFALFVLVCATAVTVGFAASGSAPAAAPARNAAAASMPASPLFDHLGTDPDVVYLIANSSVIFGPDPHGRSEEITFVGPVTVPKWPMKGYGRRILPDGRQQIDIELTQSELTGESYVLAGPVVLAEHPDLRSLGTITERPQPAKRTGVAPAANKTEDPADAVPADFVVERKILLTTSKGVLYNETAVPVRGRIDAIPPVKLQGTPTGVNTFRGMELPVALLDREGNVNGWFYSKAHMAYAVKPAAIERSFLKGTIALRSGEKTENVTVSGPVEIHHLTAPASTASSELEVMVLALRGHSDLLGGDIMVSESFSDRDHFSRGKLAWQGKDSADSAFDLFIDVYTPSAKLSTREPLPITGKLSDCKVNGKLDKGKLSLSMMGGKGHFASNGARVLYDESEKPVLKVDKMQFELAERM